MNFGVLSLIFSTAVFYQFIEPLILTSHLTVKLQEQLQVINDFLHLSPHHYEQHIGNTIISLYSASGALSAFEDRCFLRVSVLLLCMCVGAQP